MTSAPPHRPEPDSSAPAPAGKGRRGSEQRQREDGVFVRLLPAELARLAEEAAVADLTVPGYLRAGRLGDAAAGPRANRPRLPPIDAALLARNNAELNRIGSNLNQTTRALNELALTGMQDGADELLRRIGEILETNRTMYRDLLETLAANRRALGYDSEG